jgi:IS1 transposase
MGNRSNLTTDCQSRSSLNWINLLLRLGLVRGQCPPYKANATVGKRHTQKIERKHLTLRTRIKRLARKTICFSKSSVMHDVVIGLFMNRVAFGLTIP